MSIAALTAVEGYASQSIPPHVSTWRGIWHAGPRVGQKCCGQNVQGMTEQGFPWHLQGYEEDKFLPGIYISGQVDLLNPTPNCR
jgi:hypothetical protein